VSAGSVAARAHPFRMPAVSTAEFQSKEASADWGAAAAMNLQQLRGLSSNLGEVCHGAPCYVWCNERCYKF
jgi:hypothetical protein